MAYLTSHKVNSSCTHITRDCVDLGLVLRLNYDRQLEQVANRRSSFRTVMLALCRRHVDAPMLERRWD